MKTKKTILLILSILCLFTAKLFAQGTSCANAIGIKGGIQADFSFQPKQKARWFTFVATSARVDVQVTRTTLAVDTPFAHIDSLILYSGTCGSLTQLRYAAKADTGFYDSLPDIQALNLTPGQTYYVKVTRYLTKGNAGLAYFGFNQTYLTSAIIPSCATAACGANLLCNGNFEVTPSWATSNSYQDSSDVFKATPPGAPQNTYCTSSPNMRYYTSIFGGFASCTNDYDYTDIYRIGTTMGSSSFNNTAENGKWFMGVDCPSDECYECSSNPFRCTNNLTTTNYICTAWQQTVAVVPGATYIFECWIENMDAYSGGPYSSGATVSMKINGAAPFFQDVITGATYTHWVHVCYNWTVPAGVTHAKIQVFGQGTSNAGGYDFALDNFSFAEAKLPTITVNSTVICPGGSATLAVSHDSSGATYSWSNGATSSSITVSPATTTTYSVVETIGTCTTSATATVTLDPVAVTATSTTICQGSSATICASGATSFSWSTGATTACITVSPTTTTVYTVTGSNGVCTATATGTVTVNPTPLVCLPGSVEICPSTCTTLDGLCKKQNGIFSYTWSPTTGLSGYVNSYTATACPTANTTYTLTETNLATGCSASASETVLLYPAPTVVMSTTATCIGMCNGSATATVTSGTGPFTYSWNSGQTTSSISGLCAGTYTVTITDGNGCVTVKSVHILVVGPSVVHVSSATICSGASATICATGFGAPNYTWNTGATSACITVSPATTTTYTVTENNGSCTTTATGTVTVNPVPHICLTDSVVICPSTCVTLSGLCKRPIPGITYSWSPTATLSGNVNTYSVTACPTVNTTYSLTETNSATGCSATATEVVTLYPAPTIVMSSTPTCRGFCNATATATVTSGTGPYSYSWSTGQTTQTISGLCPGIYTVSVTDGHGCVTTATIKILAVAPPILHVTSTTICDGSSGTICASGTSTNYVWNTGATTACITASPTTTTVYTVMGSNGICSANATGTITVNPTPTICLTDTIKLCPSSCATLDGACGKIRPGVVYNWLPTTGLTGNTHSYIVSACPTVTTTYTLTATYSATGCSSSKTVVVVVYPPIHIALSSTGTCSGFCNATATATVTGGTAPFTYSWAGGQTTSTATGLCAGINSVTVTDAHGCKATATIRILAEVPPHVNVTSTTICEGSSGTICASGLGVSSYSWNTGATTACITASPSATTTYTVTGSNGLCSTVATGTITVNPTPSVCLTDTIKLCPSSCATLDGACGKIRPGIVYNWLPTTGLTGNTHSYIVTACPTVTTTYTLTATYSATGCSTSKTVVVVVYPQTTVTMASTQTCSDLCNGTASATATGGTAPYSYSWTSGQTTSAISALCAGTYTVNITDAHGCKSSGIVHITGVNPPILHVSSTTICAGTSGTICATGGTYYQWNTGSTTACITVSPSVTTTYTVHTSNFSNGFCKSTATGTVTVTAAPVLCLQDSIVICPNKCATLNTGACKPEASTTYAWAPSTGLSATTGWNVTACPTVTTVYTLTATNTITGCTTTGTTTVVIFPSVFTITGPTGIQCGTVNTYSVSPALPAPVVYNWISTNPNQSGTGTTANVAFNSPGGTITWEPFMPNGCKAIVTYSVSCGLIRSPEHADGSIINTTAANVYPNPAGDKLNVQIELEANQQVEMCIYNSIGEVVKCETLKDNLSIVSTSELPAGIYFYRISNNDGGLIKADKVMIVH